MKNHDCHNSLLPQPPQEALMLAETYEEKSAFRPALLIYKSLLKTTQTSLRAKINIGNVQFKLNNYPLAIKYYKMALDQVGQNDKVVYAKIMHNIGLALIQQELYSEAGFVFAYIVNQCPDLKAYIHLVLCAYARGSASKIRQYFPGIFTLPAIDDIEQIEKIVPLIATLVEDNEEEGFNWCVDIIRITNYAWIADNLEVARIVRLMRCGRMEEALAQLERFEVNVEKLTEKSKVNLSFVYLKLGEFSKVEQLLEDCTSVKAYNNFGVLKLMQGDCVAAREILQMASDCDEKFYEASYNLALAEKKLGHSRRARELLDGLRGTFPFPCNPMVSYQMMRLSEGKKSAYGNLQSNLELYGLSCVADPKTMREIGDLYGALSNQKMSSWYLEEAHAVNPLL